MSYPCVHLQYREIRGLRHPRPSQTISEPRLLSNIVSNKNTRDPRIVSEVPF